MSCALRRVGSGPSDRPRSSHRSPGHSYADDREIVARLDPPDGCPDGCGGSLDEASSRRLLRVGPGAGAAAVDLAALGHGDRPDGCVHWPDGGSYCAFGVSLTEWSVLLGLLVQQTGGGTLRRGPLTSARRVRPTDWATASLSLQEMAVNAARRAVTGA